MSEWQNVQMSSTLSEYTLAPAVASDPSIQLKKIKNHHPMQLLDAPTKLDIAFFYSLTCIYNALLF